MKFISFEGISKPANPPRGFIRVYLDKNNHIRFLGAKI